jgi:hypothetical protein
MDNFKTNIQLELLTLAKRASSLKALRSKSAPSVASGSAGAHSCLKEIQQYLGEAGLKVPRDLK